MNGKLPSTNNGAIVGTHKSGELNISGPTYYNQMYKWIGSFSGGTIGSYNFTPRSSSDLNTLISNEF